MTSSRSTLFADLIISVFGTLMVKPLRIFSLIPLKLHKLKFYFSFPQINITYDSVLLWLVGVCAMLLIADKKHGRIFDRDINLLSLGCHIA